MRKTGLMLAAAAALSIAAPANAVIVNYTFGGTGAGTMALDQAGSNYTLSALNLTIGSGNFTQANSAILGLTCTTNCLLGSTALGGPGVAAAGTNSFFFFFDPNLTSQTGSSFFWGQPGETVLHQGDTINITRLASTAPVPEPATWAMMLLGFGAIGFAMRRGRKVLQPA